ncbi:hypothetical protein FGO68_gene4342 [Halteria grandinella]|uniref:RRM domain-containing protein n=1 Tax=Halteria grandinella TaxID=5974 RepID=A0A8J8SWP0_HALGN|nr:hypothetical protein FGO68_gene4342 [Halteria grandinella]
MSGSTNPQQGVSQAQSQIPLSTSVSGAPSQNDLHARKVYVGGIPRDFPGDQVIRFLVDTLTRAGGVLDPPGNPVLKNFINSEKRFIFMEFRSVEEAYAAIQLDGIRFHGVNLRIRWTDDYEKLGPIRPRRQVPVLDTAALGIISTKVEEGPLKVFIGGLPKELSEEQIKNLLLNYGRLKSFHLVKDNKDLTTSRGFAFCEYTDERGVSHAIKYLNGLKIYGRSINVRRTLGAANICFLPSSQLSDEQKRVFSDNLTSYISLVSEMIVQGQELNAQQAMISPLQYGSEELEKHNDQMSTYIRQHFSYNYTSTVIELKVPSLTREMLENDTEYAGVCEELSEELRKFGSLRQFFFNGEDMREVFVPRPRDLNIFTTIQESAIGKAYAEFEEVTAAFACYNLMNNRVYMGMPVEINFANKDQFLTKQLN